MDLGAPPERVAAKEVPEEWQEASPLNQNKPSHNPPHATPQTNEQTHKHATEQTYKATNNKKQTNKQTQEDTRTEPLPSLPYHGDDAIVQLELTCH